MKCSKCGKRFNSLPAMAKHYRKKHPAAMKRKPRSISGKVLRFAKKGDPCFGYKFCPHCGGSLG